MDRPAKFAAVGWSLAFDTSSPTSALALGQLEELEPRYCDVRLDGANQASVDLHLRVQTLLARAGIAFDQLVAVGCGRGPGTFSGSRVALATAKGIALAIERPIFGLSTLQAIAAGARNIAQDELILALLDARRGELYGQAFVVDTHVGDDLALVDALRPLTEAACADLNTHLDRAISAADSLPRTSERASQPNAPRIRLVGPGAAVQQAGPGPAHVVVDLAPEATSPHDAALGVTARGLWLAMRSRVRHTPDDLTGLDVEYLRASYAELGLNAPKRPPSASPFVDLDRDSPH